MCLKNAAAEDIVAYGRHNRNREDCDGTWKGGERQIIVAAWAFLGVYLVETSSSLSSNAENSHSTIAALQCSKGLILSNVPAPE